MKWTTPRDLRAQVQRLWDRGLLLRSLVEGESLFPRRLNFQAPSPAELSECFEQARSWISELRQGQHYRVQLREVRLRILGTNTIPEQVWVDTLEDALALIGKRQQAKHFQDLLVQTCASQPLIVPWLAKNPLWVLDHAEVWPLLLKVVAWIQEHPQPSIYLRQIDLPGIHTKFIEAHRAVLAELLDLALPSDVINFEAVGADQFCQRYGFRSKPLRVRLRVLDPLLSLFPGALEQDFELTQATFARLDPEVEQVFITENEINFLAFPNVANSLVIFGRGYGAEMYSEATWLHSRRIYYWGDIDTHGFSILDQLRTHLPHAQSFLMDRDTLLAHEKLWGEEPQPASRNLPRLTLEERELFEHLLYNHLGVKVRLEQERIGFHWLNMALESLHNTWRCTPGGVDPLSKTGS